MDTVTKSQNPCVLRELEQTGELDQLSLFSPDESPAALSRGQTGLFPIVPGEMALPGGTVVKNFDQAGVLAQIQAERILSESVLDDGHRGTSYLYRGRNVFEPVPAFEALSYRRERLTELMETNGATPCERRLSDESVVFFGNTNPRFNKRICDVLGARPGQLLLEKFPNSESRIEIHESVRDRHAFVVASMNDPVNESLVETALLVQALKLADARRITVVVPYFGYSRQDRKADTRPPISAKAVAEMLESQGAHSIVTVDLHATQVEGFFDGPFDNLSGLQQIIPHVLKEEGADLVVISPDAGGSKRAEKFARGVERLSGSFTPLIVMSKFREGPGKEPTVTLTAGAEFLHGKTCVIVDDMIDTGGSIVAAAKALKERGAARVIVCASHGVFSQNAIDRLQQRTDDGNGGSRAIIDNVYVTDTLPVSRATGGFLKVVSIAPLLAETILRLDHPLGSLSDLGERSDLGCLI